MKYRISLVTIMAALIVAECALNWEEYSSCGNAMQIWLIVTYGAIYIASLAVICYANNIRNRLRALLTIGVFLVGWTMFGTVEFKLCKPNNYRQWILLAVLIITYGASVMCFVFVVLYLLLSYLNRQWVRLHEVIDNSDEDDFVMVEVETNTERLNLVELSKISSCKIEEGMMGNVCSICCADYKKEDIISVMPGCKHTFHHSCITKWLTLKSFCPLCRRDIRDDIKA